MKKKWIITSAVVLLLMFSFYGYLKYRAHKSYENSIHEKASLIFKLNTDQAIKTTIADFFRHPGYYINDTCKSAAPDAIKEHGLSFPANIFVYNISGRQPTTFYSMLPVSDVDKLKLYLKSTVKLDTILEINGLNYGSDSSGKISVCFNGKVIAVAYSFRAEQVRDVLQDMVKQDHMLDAGSEKIKSLKKRSSTFSWLSESGSGDVQFMDGKVIAEGEISVKDLIIPDQPVRKTTFPEKGVLRGWMNADLRPLLQHSVFSWQGIQLNTDSIFRYYRNYIDFHIDGMGKQQERVVSYEYDDNFEKVATTTLKTVEVPDLTISLASEPQPLASYLSGAGLLIDHQLNPRAFPLFKMYFHQEGRNVLEINTLRKSIPSADYQSDPRFFFIAADISQWKKMNYFNLPAVFPKSIVAINAEASKISRERAKFKVVVELSQKNRNAISQLANYRHCD